MAATAAAAAAAAAATLGLEVVLDEIAEFGVATCIWRLVDIVVVIVDDDDDVVDLIEVLGEVSVAVSVSISIPVEAVIIRDSLA